MSRFTALIREVHRRSLWQVLAIYLVGAWIAYEVILGLTEGGVLPEWFPGVAVGLFLVGLPIVLATAFVQEGGPGLADGAITAADSASRDARAATTLPSTPGPETPSPAAPSRPAVILTWRNAVGLGVAAFVFAGLVGVTAMQLGDRTEQPGAESRSLAVLPLENMSPDPDDAFFTDGIHEEIITRLFRVEDLRTLARASVMEFSGSDRTLAEVADALGVRYLLVGSVRRSGSRSRVSVSLVEPRSGEQLWANTYDADGTDVFAVQASIAENVAKALAAELTPRTRARLASVPTTSPEAYDEYLRGRELHNRSYGRDDLAAAVLHYERAIRADPDFALAHAHLSMAHSQVYWFHYDRSEATLRRARHHVDRALELDPDLPEAHLAMARYHYWGHLDYEDALRELDIAAAGLPSDPAISLTIGSVHRRAGRFDRAIAQYERTTALDPNDWSGWWNLAETYALVRRFDDALRAVEVAGRTGLNVGDLVTFKATVHLHGLGSPSTALAILDSIRNAPATGEYLPDLVRVEAYTFQRDYDRALAATGDAGLIRNQFYVRPRTLLRGMVYRHTGNGASAAAAFDSARALLEPELERNPGDVRIMGALAIAMAGLDRPEHALQLAQRALDEMPPTREAWRGAFRVLELATVQAMSGRHDEAITNLEWLLSTPSPLASPGVELDPTWNPLHHLPGFQGLTDSSTASAP